MSEAITRPVQDPLFEVDLLEQYRAKVRATPWHGIPLGCPTRDFHTPEELDAGMVSPAITHVNGRIDPTLLEKLGGTYAEPPARGDGADALDLTLDAGLDLAALEHAGEHLDDAEQVALDCCATIGGVRDIVAHTPAPRDPANSHYDF